MILRPFSQLQLISAEPNAIRFVGAPSGSLRYRGFEKSAVDCVAQKSAKSGLQGGALQAWTKPHG